MLPKHITEYQSEAFTGFRVAIQKKGIIFVKYFSMLRQSREEALDAAIAYESSLSTEIAKCKTMLELVELYKNHASNN